jgi:glutaminase
MNAAIATIAVTVGIIVYSPLLNNPGVSAVGEKAFLHLSAEVSVSFSLHSSSGNKFILSQLPL